MKTKTFLHAIYCMVIMFIFSSFQMPQDHKVLFEKAKYTMETKADLKEAIDLFESIVKNYPDETAYVAKSLLYQGLCYEKLGNQEAVKKYQKLVDNYPGQKDEVAIARERLSRLILADEEITKTPLTPKFTKINIPTNLPQFVALSPDGKNLALVSANKLWKMPLSGNLGPDIPGIPEQIHTDGVLLNDWAPLSWSLNGKWIAFNGNPKLDDKGNVNENQSIYIVSSDGGKPKKVIEINRDMEAVNYHISLSTNGNDLAFSSVEENKQHIFSTPVDKVKPRQLVEMEAREPVFSPDGKYIAFVKDKNKGKSWVNSGLWVVEANGGKPYKLADADRASTPIWSPDGKLIAFYDASLYTQITIVPFSKTANTIGKVIRIDVPAGNLLTGLAGWTHDNKIGVSTVRTFQSWLYTMPVEGGQAVEIFHRTWAATQPRWSKNGEQIYFVSSKILESVSASGGERKQYRTKKGKSFNQLGFLSGNRVSPDGKWIVTSTWTKADTNTINVDWPTSKIWKLSVDGEDAIQVTNTPGNFWDSSPCWSPDGKKIAFVQTELVKKDIYGDSHIYIIDSNGGEPELLDPNPCNWTTHLIWSPDGKMIAYTDGNPMAEDPVRLKIMDIESRESSIIAESLDISIQSELVWSPDSKRIAFNDAAGKAIKIMNIDDGSIEVIEPRLVDARMVHLDWSPDGKRFVFGARNSKVREFWFMEDLLPLDKLAQKKEKESFVIRKVIDGTDAEFKAGKPSPDGKYFIFTDWDTGNLALYESTTGKKRLLTKEGSWEKDHIRYVENATWSPDGKQIVYDWQNEDGSIELHLVGIDGSNSRILYKNEEWIWIQTFDWSSDGKQILTCFQRKDGTRQIVLVNAENGSVRVLKSLEGKNWIKNMSFSADGRYIVYDYPPEKYSRNRDIYVISTDGGHEISLIKHPANDYVLGWTPDGENILFASNRTGTFDAFVIKVVEGKPQAPPKLIKSDIGNLSPRGFTQEGSFYYSTSKGGNNVYTAELDPETGKILAPPKMAIKRFEGFNHYPYYSPDGKSLAYISDRNDQGIICIRNLETGEDKEFILKGHNIKGARNFCWSSDCSSILVKGIDNKNRYGIFRINVQTGNFTPVIPWESWKSTYLHSVELSRDEKAVFYVDFDNSNGWSVNNPSKIIKRDLETGAEKEIYRFDTYINMSLSPNGKWLVTSHPASLKVMSVSGGEPRELYTFKEEYNLGRPVTWSADGKYIIFSEKKPGQNGWELCRISVENGEKQNSGLKMENDFDNLSAHPNNRNIAYSSDEKRDEEFWVMENFLPKE